MPTAAEWRYNAAVGAVVTDQQVGLHPPDAEVRSYYGGDLICESVTSSNGHLIKTAPNLFELLETYRADLPGRMRDEFDHLRLRVLGLAP